MKSCDNRTFRAATALTRASTRLNRAVQHLYRATLL